MAAAAAALCPIMWEWVQQVGAAFNDAAADVAELPEPEQRRSRWFEGLDRMVALDEQLLADVRPLADDEVLAPLVVDIDGGVEASLREIDDIRALFMEAPEIDEQRHQARTSQIIVRVEKVIDVAKPELADHDTDGTLIAAFAQVPSCRHSLKDVPDLDAQSGD
jgi:hypothetical protein